MDQFWTSQNSSVLGLTTVGTTPNYLRSDGTDVWVSNSPRTISRVRASDGKLLETWTGAAAAREQLVGDGENLRGGIWQPRPALPDRSLTAGRTRDDGREHAGCVPFGIGFDGGRIWTANNGRVRFDRDARRDDPVDGHDRHRGLDNPSGSSTTAATSGSRTKRGDAAQARRRGSDPPDGHPWRGSAVSGLRRLEHLGSRRGHAEGAVVRASTGALLATLTGNGIASLRGGVRRPADPGRDSRQRRFALEGGRLEPIGAFPLGAGVDARGACSDGVNFWIAFHTPGQIARF